MSNISKKKWNNNMKTKFAITTIMAMVAMLVVSLNQVTTQANAETFTSVQSSSQKSTQICENNECHVEQCVDNVCEILNSTKNNLVEGIE